VAVTGSSCHLTGLPEGQNQHFEVTAVYQGPEGAELTAPVAEINAIPRSEAQPISKLRVRLDEVSGAVRIRVAWIPVDSSDVHIRWADTPPSWSLGTWVSPEEMTGFGQEITGRRIPRGKEVSVEVELPAGVHYLVPFSKGGTGIVVGRPETVGVTEPVRHLSVTPFATYATLSWEWPARTQLAEVSWELDGNADVNVISIAEYRTLGGARVPLGRGPCSIEVRAVIVADGKEYTSPPKKAVVESPTEPVITYTVSSTPALGPFGGRSKKVVFTSDQGSGEVHVRMVATPGRVMPAGPQGGYILMDTKLTLRPRLPAEYTVTVPRAVKRPYWVRCFVMAGEARLMDPPVSSLKEG
jgi:hypothetical protein